MGWVCSANLGRKREMAVSRPMKRSTSLTRLGLRISIIALHFPGLVSMSRCVIMNPRNLPRLTLNTYFSELRRRLYCLNAEKTVDKS